MSSKNGNLEQLNVWPIAAWEWPRPIMFVPLERTISYASHVMPWIQGIAATGIPWLHRGYDVTDVARNRAAEAMLEKTDKTHIIMLDLDHVHPLDIVQRFSRWFIQDPELKVVGGLNFRRGKPYNPCCFIKTGENEVGYPNEWGPGLIKVDSIGTGSIMIAREVFEEIEPPWFYYPYDRVQEKNLYLSDDVGFSRNCAAAGIPMYVDTTTTSPHIPEDADNFIDEQTFRAWQADPRNEEQERLMRLGEDGNYERVH